MSNDHSHKNRPGSIRRSFVLGFSATVLPVTCLSAVSEGQVQPALGFTVETFANVAARDMAFGPGGSWGTDLYVSSGNAILRIAPNGTITTLAGGLQTPTGIAFSQTPAFGDFLYVAERTANRISRVSSLGVPAAFTPAFSGAADPIGITFGPGSGGFSSNLFVAMVSAAGGVPGTIFEVNSLAVPTTRFTDQGSSNTDVAFVSGAGFGNMVLLSSEIGNFCSTNDPGSVQRFTNSFSATVLATLVAPTRLVQGPGGVWSNDVYLYDTATRRISRLRSDGTLFDFATGFEAGTPTCQSELYRDAGAMVFAPDRSAFYASDFTTGRILRFKPAAICTGDANNDRSVTFLDITTVLANFGSTCP